MTYQVKASSLMIEFGSNGQGTVTTSSSKGATGAAMGRGGSGWDDDE